MTGQIDNTCQSGRISVSRIERCDVETDLSLRHISRGIGIEIDFQHIILP